MSVLDASVILKWFVDERDSDQALRLREEFYRGEREIVVPDILLYEIANALQYNPSFSTEEINEVLETLFDIGIGIITPTYSLLAKTTGLAKRLDITCYDATYLALAEELGFEFVTADEKFYRKASSGKGFKAVVKLLHDLERN